MKLANATIISVNSEVEHLKQKLQTMEVENTDFRGTISKLEEQNKGLSDQLRVAEQRLQVSLLNKSATLPKPKPKNPSKDSSKVHLTYAILLITSSVTLTFFCIKKIRNEKIFPSRKEIVD